MSAQKAPSSECTIKMTLHHILWLLFILPLTKGYIEKLLKVRHGFEARFLPGFQSDQQNSQQLPWFWINLQKSCVYGELAKYRQGDNIRMFDKTADRTRVANISG